MPLDALPKHLQDIENNFPDDEQFGTKSWYGRLYRWYQKKTKTWFAFSYRCKFWWAKWRKYPKVLFAIRGKGKWRFENPVTDFATTEGTLINIDWQSCYLSRQQLYCNWHVAVQWPFMISFHWYRKANDVPVYGEPVPDLDGKVWFAYWNHFDGDLIYWMITSAYLGGNWK